MQKEILDFIKENKLTPFNKNKTIIKTTNDSIFKTKDAKSVHNKTLNKLSENFVFLETQNIWNFFKFTNEEKIIKKRQEFFKGIKKIDNSFLKELKNPKITWKPKYEVLVVTEDESTLIELKKLNCPVQYLNSQYDIEGLDNYEIIQVIDCEKFLPFLEQLPQTIILNSLDEVYLERYLIELSSWKENIDILNKNNINNELKSLINELSPLLEFTTEKSKVIISKDYVEEVLDKINKEIEEKLKEMSISGLSLFSMLSKGKLPSEIEKILNDSIKSKNLPEEIFNLNIPLTIDEIVLNKIIKEQNANINTNIASEIKKHSKSLRMIPEKLNELGANLILFDFISGISNYLESLDFPIISDEFEFIESSNLFIKNSQKISFHLSNENKCSILTGANSGGKTTLLEHIIQIIAIFQIGLPQKNLKIPIFTDIYYFAKTKGSTGKGAFENLLSQMDKIKPGIKTLILADEIEAVTEPGVAGKIISATAEFFINKGCFLVIATHLGEEIQKALPKNTRIDGIEAKGLNEFYDLIVDHNPILGKLASSTPELIVEKMASSIKTPYLEYLYDKIKKDKK